MFNTKPPFLSSWLATQVEKWLFRVQLFVMPICNQMHLIFFLTHCWPHFPEQKLPLSFSLQTIWDVFRVSNRERVVSLNLKEFWSRWIGVRFWEQNCQKKVKTLGRKVIKWQISTILGTSHLGSKKLRLPRAVSLKV